jgi:hypothetical protein
MLEVTATLPVREMSEAIAFYEAAGLDVTRYDDGFTFVGYADSSVFDLDQKDGILSGANGAGCYWLCIGTLGFDIAWLIDQRCADDGCHDNS